MDAVETMNLRHWTRNALGAFTGANPGGNGGMYGQGNLPMTQPGGGAQPWETAVGQGFMDWWRNKGDYGGPVGQLPYLQMGVDPGVVGGDPGAGPGVTSVPMTPAPVGPGPINTPGVNGAVGPADPAQAGVSFGGPGAPGASAGMGAGLATEVQIPFNANAAYEPSAPMSLGTSDEDPALTGVNEGYGAGIASGRPEHPADAGRRRRRRWGRRRDRQDPTLNTGGHGGFYGGGGGRFWD